MESSEFSVSIVLLKLTVHVVACFQKHVRVLLLLNDEATLSMHCGLQAVFDGRHG